MTVARRYLVRGRVQGVGFRYLHTSGCGACWRQRMGPEQPGRHGRDCRLRRCGRAGSARGGDPAGSARRPCGSGGRRRRHVRHRAFGVRDSINHGTSQEQDPQRPRFSEGRHPLLRHHHAAAGPGRASARRSTASPRRSSDQGIDLVVGIESRGFIFGVGGRRSDWRRLLAGAQAGQAAVADDARDLRSRVRHRLRSRSTTTR